MPLYEYKCERCGGVFEVIQKFSDEPLSVHEGCGGQVERLISSAALQFKGTGWYVTDYARGKKPSAEPKPAAKSESSSTPAASSGSGKSEPSSSTPAAKPDSSK